MARHEDAMGLRECIGRGSGGSSPEAALWTLTMAAFLFPFLGAAANMAVPEVAREFHAGATTVSGFVLAYIVVSSMMLLPAARLADLQGRRRVFLVGASVVALTSVLCAWAPTFGWLLAARAIQGIGGAMMVANSVAILVALFPADQRGRVLGINVASVYLGLALGPLLGGAMVHQTGWRSLFWFSAAFAGLTVALAARCIRQEWREAQGESFDGIGAVTGALGLGLPTLGLAVWKFHEWGPWMVGLGLGMLLVFAVVETRTRQPMIDLVALARNRLFVLSNLAALIHYGSTFASTYLLSRYLQEVRGLDAREAGILLVFAPAVQALFSPVAGRLSDRVAPRWLASAGMGLSALSLALLAGVATDSPLGWVAAVLTLQGFGFALFSSPNTNAVMSSVDRRFYSTASAVLASMRQAGMTFSLAVVTLVLSVHLGDAPVTPAQGALFVRGMGQSFAGFAVLCVIGVLASLARGRRTDA